jgi:Winged helix-turn-helix DNA-binding
MASFVDTTVHEIDSRLKELKEEEARLTAARSALVGAAKRGPGRPRGTAAAPAAAKPTRRRARTGRPRGRRGGNTRSNQALELVRSNPGITIPKIAESLKIEPNYLYRVMPKLVSEGLITRDGLAYHPAKAAAAAK